MTKAEKQIILDALKERKKAMLYYYEHDKKEDHKVASEAYRAIKEVAESLGIMESK